MKFFIDTANLNEINEAHDLGILDGVTTNPSLMAKEGISGDSNILNHYSENNTYDIAVFNKKKEYGSAKLDLKKVNDPKKQKIFLGNNNLIVSNFDLKIQKLKNSEINQLIY